MRKFLNIIMLTGLILSCSNDEQQEENLDTNKNIYLFKRNYENIKTFKWNEIFNKRKKFTKKIVKKITTFFGRFIMKETKYTAY